MRKALLLFLLTLSSCSSVSTVMVGTPAIFPQIVLIPDIQLYSAREAHRTLLSNQVQWVADHIESENIVFVTQVGDLVHRLAGEADVDLNEQWVFASSTFDLLDEVIPYSVALGNHDFDTFNRPNEGAEVAKRYFGASRYQHKGWFDAVSPDGESFSQLFEIEDNQLLHVALRWIPDEQTINWAKYLIRERNLPTIITTHDYLTDSGTNRLDEVVRAGRSRRGESLWSNLVNENDQIFMVIGGHSHAGLNITKSGEYNEDGEYHQKSINAAGREVIELLANYQDYPNGGDGWLQLLRIDLNGKKLSVRTYSPYLEKFQTDDYSDFELKMDFLTRWRLP